MSSIPDYLCQAEVKLPPRHNWPAAVHMFDSTQAAALRAAEAAGRPLLVRGLPGLGKSQLARAAAVAANRRFVWAVMDSRTEAQDLQWRFDAVGRLADAQRKTSEEVPPRQYLSPGPLWAAFDWIGAQKWCHDVARIDLPGWMDAQPGGVEHTDDKVVLLLDEIDKADPDLPNALLEVLAGDGFQVQVPGVDPVGCGTRPRPLIIITTNEDRELPPAFLRRCFAVTLTLPSDLKSHCVLLAQRHQAYLVSLQLRSPEAVCNREVLEHAADALLSARETASGQHITPPATAEYLDLVRALAVLHPGDPVAQRRAVEDLSGFAFDKALSSAAAR